MSDERQQGGVGSALILVVDDDVDQRRILERWFQTEGYEVESFAEGGGFLHALPRLQPSAICLDFHMPGLNGLDLLESIRKLQPHVPVLFATGDSDIETVVTAMQRGAYNYLVKPLDRRRLLTEVRNAVDRAQMTFRLAELERQASGGYAGIVGQSTALQTMFRHMDRLAASDISVLIRGESGTGKELVARGVHNHSRRSEGPFVAINCAAIPEGLIESVLFGHEKGAFTGATQRQTGRFAEANGGTIFLDEIAELDPSIQAKLLRVLQESTFRPVGSSREQSSDFRLLAASHRNLAEEVREGRFREDLFFRVAVFELDVPALRERDSDVLLLAEHFVERYAQAEPTPQLGADATRILEEYSWPGNVRELENAIQHALVVCDETIAVGDLPQRIRAGGDRSGDSPETARRDSSGSDEAEVVASEIAPGARESTSGDRLDPAAASGSVAVGGEDSEILTLAEVERRAIEHAVRSTGGNLSEACRLLGIGRTTLYRKLRRYGIS